MGNDLDGERFITGAKSGEGPLGFVLEETLIFFAFQHPETSLEFELVKVLFNRLCARFRGRYGLELCQELNQDIWLMLLQPSSTARLWAQLCFWRFAFHRFKNLLKKKRRATKACSLDSELGVRWRVLKSISPGLSPDEVVYLREVMLSLPPYQCAAFQLRHECGFSLSEIGAMLKRDVRTVRRLLKSAERHFRSS
ncbi:MAG: hypothetical protein JWM21_864 [Acidobacteria bacterium]|nr:hypothetical protein [Acidobacteriota bacterium]